MCAQCGVESAGGRPVVRAWTGDLFVTYTGGAPDDGSALINWVKDYADWPLDAPGDGGLPQPPLKSGPDQPQANNAGAAPLPRGVVTPWEGEALPGEIFLPTAPADDRTIGRGGLRPVVVVFHGGNDGPYVAMEQQGAASSTLFWAHFSRNPQLYATLPPLPPPSSSPPPPTTCRAISYLLRARAY